MEYACVYSEFIAHLYHDIHKCIYCIYIYNYTNRNFYTNSIQLLEILLCMSDTSSTVAAVPQLSALLTSSTQKIKAKTSMEKSLTVEYLLPLNVGTNINYLH